MFPSLWLFTQHQYSFVKFKTILKVMLLHFCMGFYCVIFGIQKNIQCIYHHGVILQKNYIRFYMHYALFFPNIFKIVNKNVSLILYLYSRFWKNDSISLFQFGKKDNLLRIASMFLRIRGCLNYFDSLFSPFTNKFIHL